VSVISYRRENQQHLFILFTSVCFLVNKESEYNLHMEVFLNRVRWWCCQNIKQRRRRASRHKTSTSNSLSYRMDSLVKTTHNKSFQWHTNILTPRIPSLSMTLPSWEKKRKEKQNRTQKITENTLSTSPKEQKSEADVILDPRQQHVFFSVSFVSFLSFLLLSLSFFLSLFLYLFLFSLFFFFL